MSEMGLKSMQKLFINFKYNFHFPSPLLFFYFSSFILFVLHFLLNFPKTIHRVHITKIVFVFYKFNRLAEIVC